MMSMSAQVIKSKEPDSLKRTSNPSRRKAKSDRKNAPKESDGESDEEDSESNI